MVIELKNLGKQKNKTSESLYEGNIIGDFAADILVNEKVFVELKAAESLCDDHAKQLINYLKSTPIEVGLLFNFGKKPELKRKIFTNDRKINMTNLNNSGN
jgi:GxxExxY protein